MRDYPYYDLDGEPHFLDWDDPDDLALLTFFWSADYRRVAETTVGDAYVSTVLLPIDHNWGRSDRPIIFETMVFDYMPPRSRLRRFWAWVRRRQPRQREYQWRYATREQALRGHERVVEAARSGSLTDDFDLADDPEKEE